MRSDRGSCTSSSFMRWLIVVYSVLLLQSRTLTISKARKQVLQIQTMLVCWLLCEWIAGKGRTSPKSIVFISLLAVLWSFTVVVLNGSYSGGLVSDLLIAVHHHLVDSLEELSRSSIAVIVQPGTALAMLFMVSIIFNHLYVWGHNSHFTGEGSQKRYLSSNRTRFASKSGFVWNLDCGNGWIGGCREKCLHIRWVISLKDMLDLLIGFFFCFWLLLLRFRVFKLRNI